MYLYKGIYKRSLLVRGELKMDNNVVESLIQVLEQEAKSYEYVLMLSKQKTDVIIKNKVTELENIVKTEHSLTIKLGKLEAMRENYIMNIAEFIKKDASNITISELIKYIEFKLAKRLKSIQEKIMSIIKELKKVNELNKELIKNSLDYLNFSLNLITTVGAVNNNYGNNGQISQGKKRNIFDLKLNRFGGHAMAVGFGSFEIARSGMSTSERALFVTGHNMSNVNTPGYVRQQAMVSTAPWQNVQDINGSYQLGTGVDIEQIRQLRNSFLDNIYRQE